MVRCVKSCHMCSVRFIALANAAHCDACSQVTTTNTSWDASKASKGATKESNTPKTVETIELDDDSESESLGSEGGDDINCTQLLPEHDSGDDGAILVPKGDDSQTQVKNDGAVIETRVKASSGDICFICGASLKNLKRRLDHIKRCSKKHSITGKDVKVDTEVKHFEETAKSGIVTNNSLNPYTRENTWHGDANLTLRLAGDANSSSASDYTAVTTKQTLLNNYIQNPVRNMNNILLAGARRMSKAAQVKASAASSAVQQKLYGGKKRRRSSGFNQKTYSSACPAYKKITGTDFVCDGFHYAKSSLTKNYFLTHFHSDHYGGIAKTWDAGIIYCSLPTAELVAQQLGVDRKYLHPLPMNTPTIIESKEKPVTVTLLDANHCPGAVMFLFEVGKKKILHVGDFRWNRECMLQQWSPLRSFVSEQHILDELYLDTTYCDPKYKLPPQADTIAAIQDLFQKEMNRSKERKNGKTLHLFGAYTIGKERMYLSIAERYKMKIYVDSRRYRILSALNWPQERMALLTKYKEEACIWVVPLGDINMKKLPEYFAMANNKPLATQYDRIIGYRPTGWSLGSKPSSALVSTRTSGNISIHSVPYSEHSSFPELVDCLANLKPQCIIPTVSVGKSEEQISMLMKSLKERQTTLPFATTKN